MLSACSASVTTRLRVSDMVIEDCGDLLRMIQLVPPIRRFGVTWNDFPNGMLRFDAPLTVFRSRPQPKPSNDPVAVAISHSVPLLPYLGRI